MFAVGPRKLAIYSKTSKTILKLTLKSLIAKFMFTNHQKLNMNLKFNLNQNLNLDLNLNLNLNLNWGILISFYTKFTNLRSFSLMVVKTQT